MGDQAGPASPTATQPVTIGGQAGGEYWWQALPRKLSLTSSWTRTRSISENEAADNNWNSQPTAAPSSLTAIWNRTRTRSISESSESEHTATTPSVPTPPAVSHTTETSRGRRYSEASASGDKATEIRARWNRCHDLPRESFVPPWI